MYSVASLLRTPLGPHYLSLIHVQCSLFIKDTIGPTLPVLNTEVSSFQRYFCIGLYQLGHYTKSPHYRGVLLYRDYTVHVCMSHTLFSLSLSLPLLPLHVHVLHKDLLIIIVCLFFLIHRHFCCHSDDKGSCQEKSKKDKDQITPVINSY